MDPSEPNPNRFAGPSQWADHFDASIRAETTRAKVVISAIYLDELLGQLVRIILKPHAGSDDPLLDGAQAPLGTFSAKIEIVFRLGVITEEVRTSLHLVRKIRNHFAHRLSDCSFEDRKVAGWAEALHRFNDHATEETRARYSAGAEGDFEKSVSWLVFWIKHLIDSVPTTCPSCGSEIEHRAKIKEAAPHS